MSIHVNFSVVWLNLYVYYIIISLYILCYTNYFYSNMYTITFEFILMLGQIVINTKNMRKKMPIDFNIHLTNKSF